MASSRFINTSLSELQEANHNPISGYEESPLLTLEEAVEKIIPLVSDVMDYVSTAKKKFNRHSDLLTRDESAAIYLYSMLTPFFSCLNETLRNKNRDAVKSWFAFLKLFITALRKLPSCSRTVYRGVKANVLSNFVERAVHTWRSVNSCSAKFNVAGMFAGENGTVFCIQSIYGKNIAAYSANPKEEEFILLPGTRLRVVSKEEDLFGLSIVHLEEW